MSMKLMASRSKTFSAARGYKDQKLCGVLTSPANWIISTRQSRSWFDVAIGNAMATTKA